MTDTINELVMCYCKEHFYSNIPPREALYINGENISMARIFTERQFRAILTKHVPFTIEVKFSSWDWLKKYDQFPNELKDVEFIEEIDYD